MRESKKGSPFPFGASFQDGWWNFSVYATTPISSLVLGEYTLGTPQEEIELDPSLNKTGDIWHISLKAREEKIRWGCESRFEKGGKKREDSCGPVCETCSHRP